MKLDLYIGFLLPIKLELASSVHLAIPHLDDTLALVGALKQTSESLLTTVDTVVVHDVILVLQLALLQHLCQVGSSLVEPFGVIHNDEALHGTLLRNQGLVVAQSVGLSRVVVADGPAHCDARMRLHASQGKIEQLSTD
jgi:hypothetical protein